jgi:NitT/TauT family transport system permease protein
MRKVLVAILALAVLAVAWELVGRLLRFPWFPPLSVALGALAELHRQGLIWTNLLASLRSLAIGFGLALVFGVVVGTLLGRYRRLEYLFGIYVQALVFAPSIVFAPIFFTLFGLSDATRIGVVFLYSAFIMAVNTQTAVRHVDRSLVEMATVFGASERKIVLKVIVPAALPLIMAGVRLGAGRAVKGMINGEAFVALVGLGGLIETYGGRFAADKVLALLIVVVSVSVLVASLVQWLDRRLTAWNTV